MFRIRSIAIAAAVALLAGILSVTTPARAQVEEPQQEIGPITVKAGYGEADATWHVGAGAGQYSNKSVEDPERCMNAVSGEDVDPHGHSVSQCDSYGVQSRLSYRAIVVEDAEGDQVAFVKSDSYLAQDYLTRRVGQILMLSGESEISHDEIFHMASHNHSSPYYMTPSWGVWLFQDAFDIRAFEYHARAMAAAIMRAEENMVDAQMGATTVTHNLFKGMIQRKRLADDGTPGGYPDDFGDLGVSIVRFDSLENPAVPVPLATMINWGQHPEGLDSHDLITGDFVASLERFVERDTGAPLVFGQGDVGSAEAGPGRPELVAQLGIPARWSHAGHAQAERGALLLSRDVVAGWKAILLGSPVVPFSADFDVAAGNAWVPGPYSHPYPSVSNCRSETTAKGDAGVVVAGLPDCAREDPKGPFRDLWKTMQEEGAPLPDDDEFWAAYDQIKQGLRESGVWEGLKEAGVPLPEHYDASAYTGVEENLRIHLQAFKIGEVILGSCACEAQVDLILNFETRANETQLDIWEGFDWTDRMDCPLPESPEGDWTCTKKPDEPRPRAVLGTHTFTDYEYDRMQAQIHNKADGWDAPGNALAANAEPHDPAAIWGNFTEEELSAEVGYKLPIGVGHASDYNGYTVSYREYMGYDAYRKALTSYGPHTADYMVTRLVRLADQISDDDSDKSLNLDPGDEVRAQADEVRQVAMSTALGAFSFAVYEAWYKSLPDDLIPADPIDSQPSSIERFDAATFSWWGGSNAVDNPVARVERLVDDVWVPFADQSGEVQTKIDFPEGANAFVDTYTGDQQWLWTANFEAFNAFPRDIGSTPAGTYRFFVAGQSRKDGEDVPYQFPSERFTVGGWDGITATDLQVLPDGSVSFRVPPIVYPTTYDSVFPYVKASGKTAQGDDVIKTDELGRPFCTTCAFRPWAEAGQLESAHVTIVHADGGHSKRAATCQENSCSASVGSGEAAFIAQGDLVDNYGETNSQCFDFNGGNECPPAENDLDVDNDAVFDDTDNCVDTANPDQADADNDEVGDPCDADDEDGPQGDSDTDGVKNEVDNCPDDPNANQGDVDKDELGDACDSDSSDGPVADPDADGRTNAEETASGSDPRDACDPDESSQSCDADGDEIVNATDNCDEVANDQADVDEDGVGDACDPTDDRPTPGPTEEPSEEPSQEPSASSEPSGSPSSDPGSGGNGGGGSGGGGSGSGSSPAPTQSAAGDERGTVVTSIAADKTISNHERPVTLSGEVTGDRACATTEVEIVARTFGATEFEPVDTAEVGADGMWSTTVRSARSTAYAAQPVDNDLCEGQLSSTVDVLVRARVTASVRNRCDARHAINGRVAPAYPGTIVKLKAKKNGRWVTVDRAKLTNKSRFHFARCTGTRVVWPKQDVRNEASRAPVLTIVTIS